MNLRGFDPAGDPAAPAEAVRGFLDALGVAPERIPPSADAQAGLYRSLLAGRQMLIVLDNARDEQQVRPLLPASPGCLVLITSRSQLAGLAAADGARLLTLDVPSHAEAGRCSPPGSAPSAPPPSRTRSTEIAQPVRAAAAGAGRRRRPAAARPRLPLTALAAELSDSRRPARRPGRR